MTKRTKNIQQGLLLTTALTLASLIFSGSGADARSIKERNYKAMFETKPYVKCQNPEPAPFPEPEHFPEPEPEYFPEPEPCPEVIGYDALGL
ncbi:MAG: hypothetical protein ACK502_06035 [Alphaproteobacteria bacterium]